MVDKEFLDDLAEQRAIEEIVEKGFAGRSSSGKWKRHLVVAAAAFVFISVGAYAAFGGRLEFFRDELEAPFIDLVTAPLKPVYAEDQGIRFEVVGVERVNSVILLYMTMQDVTGENRLGSWSQDPDVEKIRINDQEVSAWARSSRELYFNEDTNTLYFELQVHIDFDMPSVDTLEVVVHRIHEFTPGVGGAPVIFAAGEWRMEVEIADTYHPTLIWESIDIPDQRSHIDYMLLNPFGVYIIGRGSLEWDVVIEVNNESIEMWGAGGSTDSDGFKAFFYAGELINIEEVTAVIFNGYRIEVPE